MMTDEREVKQINFRPYNWDDLVSVDPTSGINFCKNNKQDSLTSKQVTRFGMFVINYDQKRLFVHSLRAGGQGDGCDEEAQQGGIVQGLCRRSGTRRCLHVGEESRFIICCSVWQRFSTI